MLSPFEVAYDLVTDLTSVLTPITGGFSAAAAIVIFTACVRLALHPLSRRQATAARVRARLAPKARELQKRHRSDPVRAHREVTALYRAEGTSMWAGIGPALLQLPVFTVVYRMFLSPAIGGHANLLLTQTLLGVPLGERWLFTAGAFGPHGLIFLALFACLAAVAWWTSRRMPAESPRLLRILPFGTIAIAAYVPLAAGLYLLTTTIWTAMENATLRRGPITT